MAPLQERDGDQGEQGQHDCPVRTHAPTHSREKRQGRDERRQKKKKRSKSKGDRERFGHRSLERPMHEDEGQQSEDGSKHNGSEETTHNGREASGGEPRSLGDRRQERCMEKRGKATSQQGGGREGGNENRGQDGPVTRAPQSSLAKFLLEHVAAAPSGKFRTLT